MRVPRLRKLILSLALTEGLVVLGIFHPGAASAQQPATPFHSEFRYTILRNQLRAIGKEQVRGVTVLLDPKAFTEENLRKLFSLLRKRYPEPAWLDASVLTSLEQWRTPEEFDVYGNSSIQGVSLLPHFDDYNQAIFMWHGEDEFFRYTADSPRGNMKTVVIKGFDPATGQRAEQPPGRQ